MIINNLKNNSGNLSPNLSRNGNEGNQNDQKTPVRSLQPRFITFHEAQVITGLSEATWRRLVATGKVPVVRIPCVMGRKPENKKTKGSKDILRLDVKDAIGFMNKHKRIQ